MIFFCESGMWLALVANKPTSALAASAVSALVKPHFSNMRSYVMPSKLIRVGVDPSLFMHCKNGAGEHFCVD